MIYTKDSRYYRVCDECRETREIQKATYKHDQKKDLHLCLSCCQRGSRNHLFGKASWNKGLTKDKDERIKAYCEKVSTAKIGSIPWNKGHSYAELKGDVWAEQYKLKSSLSKKGKPNLKQRRSSVRDASWKYFRKLCKSLLYSSWIHPILERDRYRCRSCGSAKNLEVHHITPFRDILIKSAIQEGLDLNQYNSFSDDEFKRMRSTIVNMHKMEDGITLCKECHKTIDIYRRKFDES